MNTSITVTIFTLTFKTESWVIKIVAGHVNLLFKIVSVLVDITLFVGIGAIELTKFATIVLSHFRDTKVVFLLELLLLMRLVDLKRSLFFVLLYESTSHRFISRVLKIEHTAWVSSMWAAFVGGARFVMPKIITATAFRSSTLKSQIGRLR